MCDTLKPPGWIKKQMVPLLALCTKKDTEQRKAGQRAEFRLPLLQKKHALFLGAPGGSLHRTGKQYSLCLLLIGRVT